MDNTESARRQYTLNQQALALGWPANRIRVIDEDQDKSGASIENRNDFRDLMGRVANGEVGMVLSLEVSRLARDNADWHQLLRIAGLSNTLILDETGVCDPADSNDRLLLGIKGTLSEFELLGIRARMIGGMRSAAARGALKIGLPPGLVYNEIDEVVLDPDQSIVDAIAGVFTCYRRMGSIAATVRWMHQENLKLPSPSKLGLPPGRRTALEFAYGISDSQYPVQPALCGGLCLRAPLQRKTTRRYCTFPHFANRRMAGVYCASPCGIY